MKPKTRSFFRKKDKKQKSQPQLKSEETTVEKPESKIHIDKTKDFEEFNDYDTELLDKKIEKIEDKKSEFENKEKLIEDKAVKMAKSHSIFGKKEKKKKSIVEIEETKKIDTKPSFHIDNASEKISLEETELLDNKMSLIKMK